MQGALSNVGTPRNFAPSAKPPVPKLILGGSIDRPSMVGQVGSAPASARAPPHRSACLCVELVVPADTECALTVPRIQVPTATPGGTDTITIDDARGVAVFVASFSLAFGGHRPARGEGGRRLVLKSAVDEILFGFCRDAEPDSEPRRHGFAIYHASQQHFGVLRNDTFTGRGGYAVQTKKGPGIYFRGDFASGNMNATDENGRLLAIAEDIGGSRLSLRIGPRVDAGLIALAVLGIEMLELEASDSGRN